MLAALMDDRARTATELALAAGVSPSTASGHLARLLEGRLVSVVQSGRHRYYRLASPTVAQVLEKLMVLAGDGPPRHRPQTKVDKAMARARTCYDHLAGRLGVALADSLVERGLIVWSSEGGALTPPGVDLLRRAGVDVDPPKTSRRAFCRPCLDWSERRWHIGGALGAALARRCFDAEWIERRRDSRAVMITSEGSRALEALLGVRMLGLPGDC